MTPRMKDRFNGEVTEKVRSEFGVSNRQALPRLNKIIVSVGMGKQLEGTKLDPKAKEQVLQDLAMITGQKATVRRAKKSVSNFKLRVGYEIGAMVTLRGNRMWEFLDRLITLAIPRIKDFRGLNHRSFDGRGNYTFGVQEQGIFPEVDMANAQFTHGMNITLNFGNSDDEKSCLVLTELGMPFVKPDASKN